MALYGIQGKFTATTGKGQQLADILLQASNILSELDGCLLYLISQEPENPDSIWITEVWENPQAHKQSLELESIQKLIATAKPLIAGPPQNRQELVVLGGAGVK